MPTTAIVASQILDSGLTGRQLIQAADQAAAQAIIGVDPSQYGLLSANNTWTGFNTFQDDITAGFISAAGIESSASVYFSEDLEVQGSMLANSAEFSGSVEFTDLITGVDGTFSGTVQAEYLTGTNGLSTDAQIWFRDNLPQIFIRGAGGSNIFRFSSTGVLSYADVAPQSTNTVDLGLAGQRWANTYSVDGSFSGSLVSEAGGAYKLYELGTEGDADTIFGEILFSGNYLRFGSNSTGAGGGRDVLLARDGTAKMIWSTSTTTTYSTISPVTDNTMSIGKSSKRWSNVYSVDGNFTGNVTSGQMIVTDGLFAQGDAEFTGNVEFTETFTSVGGEHQGDVTVTDADLIVSGSGKLDATDGDFSGTVTAGTFTSTTGTLSASFSQVGTTAGYPRGGFLLGDTSITNVALWVAPDIVGADRPSTLEALTNQDTTRSLTKRGGVKVDTTETVFYSGYGNGLQGDTPIRFKPNGLNNTHTFQLYDQKANFYVDTYVDGSLISEVGGSYKLYNLGSEGDTDTEYLDMSWDTNEAIISTQSTGAGASRNLKLLSDGDSGFNIKANAVDLYANSTSVAKFTFGASANTTRQLLQPSADGTIGLGSSSRQWSGVYSVDGDFSGTVNTDAISSATGISLEISGAAKLQVANNGITYAYQSIQPSSTAAATTLGASPRRWGNVYSIDGSFSGNLNVEDGGAFQFYGLGTEGDTDTEFLRFDTVGSDYELATSATGAGVAGSLYISAAGSQNMMFRSDHTRILQYLRPQTTNTVDVGTDALRFRKSYFVDGDFSGTVTTNDIESAGGTMFIKSSDTSPIYIGHNGALTYGMFNTTFQPQVDDAVQIGSLTKRWQQGHFVNVYSTNGDFSGDITIGGKIKKTLTLFTEINGSIITGHSNFNFQIYKDLLPSTTAQKLNGSTTRRWLNTYSVGGSFSGSLVSEAGGSYKLYNLGSEGDTDTEYLETSFESNKATIATQSTGAGTTQSLVMSGADVRIAKANGNERYIFSDTEFRPVINDYSSLGLDSRRWSNVFSVDGDFSGTLSAVTVAGQTNNLTLQSNSGNALISVSDSGAISLTAFNTIYQQFTVDGVGYRQSLYPIFSGLDMATAATPWDTGFIDNIVSGAGGSHKLYNLGTEGDTDTEYLEISANSNTYEINSKATGVGAVRELLLGSSTDSIVAKWHGKLSPYDSSSILSMSGSMVEFGSSIGLRYIVTAETDSGGCLETAQRFSSGTPKQTWNKDGAHSFYGVQVSDPCDVRFNITNDLAGNTNYERVRINYSGTKAQILSEAGGTGTSRELVVGTNSGYQVFLGTAGQGAGLGFNGAKKVYWTTSALRPFGAGISLGARSPSVDSWALVGAVDGSFSGTLDTEVGGSVRLFNLGSDGDTDTEYGFIKWDSGTFQIGVDATGSGSNSKPVSFYTNSSFGFKNTSGQTRFNISSSNVTTYLSFQPNQNKARNLGSDTVRFARCYVNGGMFSDVETVTASTKSLVTTDSTLLCDCTSNTIAIDIPTSSAQEGNTYVIKKIDSSSNTVTITPTSRTVDGAASITLTSQYQSLTLVSDGTNWFIV